MIQNIGKQLLKRGKSVANSSRVKSIAETQKRVTGKTTARIADASEARRIDRIDKAGKKPLLGNLSPDSKKGIQAFGVGASGMYGFASGMNSDNELSDSIYELTTGDPNFDEYVMGRKVGMRSLMMPFPGERTAQGLTPEGMGGRVAIGAAGGAAAGYAGGALTSAGFNAKGLRGMAVKAGLTGLGAVAGTGAGVNSAFNNQPFRDAHRKSHQSKYKKNKVNGDIAFGMYNSRIG